MTLAIDGTAHGTIASNTTLAVNLTTTQSNDYIIVVIVANHGPVTTVSSVALGNFTFMARGGGATQVEEIWYAFSSGILTADTITVHQTSADFLTVDAFGVSGSGQSLAIFDSGGPQVGTVDPISITTVNSNTMVVAGFRTNTSTTAAGGGFTSINSINFSLVEYELLLTAQTLSCTIGTSPGTSGGGVVFGIPVASALPFGNLLLASQVNMRLM